MRHLGLAVLALALATAPAAGVGLGPLAKSGITDGPRKAFYLTLINPYPTATAFRAYAVGERDETAQPRVTIFPGETTLGGNANRRLLVIADDLAAGETYAFRVCAERAEPSEGLIHARVCSHLAARRLPAA
ncbi:hypothetical protein RCO27_09390 [Sphingosinicella sp. LHD-64]|uniref:hypothetical protein n=1 Tax=Sphingosinicella sp. LHD-64 TaxID=3072139 RepID=UPI00280EBF96|nr:hypothetical protein [Sphingosinicella sp. LHD-64]MDQ8756442.1 hypothetical protein [Sphingosinicella sp. LHD-64]